MNPEVIKALNTIKTHDEITEVWEYLRRKDKQLSMQLLDTIFVGQKVQFKGRRGVTLSGKVTAVNQTTVTVEVEDPFRGKVQWRVAASLLTAI